MFLPRVPSAWNPPLPFLGLELLFAKTGSVADTGVPAAAAGCVVKLFANNKVLGFVSNFLKKPRKRIQGSLCPDVSHWVTF